MVGGPEDHFTDSRELYVLVEGDEWAHVDLDPDAGYWARRFAQLVELAGAGRESRDRAVVPSAAELVERLKEIARLRAKGALTESEFEAVKATLLSDEASAQEAGPTPAMDEIHEPRTPHRSAPAFLARRHAAVASRPLLRSPGLASRT
jgi:hypothetical protein